MVSSPVFTTQAILLEFKDITNKPLLIYQKILVQKLYDGGFLIIRISIINRFLTM